MDDFFIQRQAPEPALNPRWLKREGIRQLQALVGSVWSHYNNVDPGVTLLEHLCWALSEVAYCADFPLEDLLTGADGNLAVPGQFPSQAEILSHQPVNDEDYAKLLFDHLPTLRALQLQTEYRASGQPTGRQRCFLAPPAGLDDAEREDLRQTAWYWLQQWRLPGECFLPPDWLTPRPLGLSARLLVNDAHQAEAIAEACRLQLDQFAAPRPRQDGYQHWRETGLDGAKIIDGPRLRQGWMPGPLPSRPGDVRAGALAALLAGIEGVQAVLQLRLLADSQETARVTLSASELIDWTLDLSVWCDNRCCYRLQGPSAVPGVAAMQAAHAASGISAGIDIQAMPPHGQYRNLAEYYPVQATLPPNWRLSGHEVDQTELQQAQTRQLQGYLLPFEQLLANQFAQLAHLGELFSPASPPATERGERPEDVPWQALARTRFNQPLYQIPGLEALISGQQQFDVWLGEPRPQQAWRSSQGFSHNAYPHALATLTESEHQAMQHRLAILRHLMARHGEQAADYDAMILACQWYGSRERTLGIVFSLWLQNLTFLSTARCCGARYPAASLRLPGDTAMVESSPALQARLAPQPGITHNQPGTPWWQRWLAWPQYNGQPDLAQIEALARIDEQDLAGLSSFELKAGLLLDLPTRLCSLATQLLRALYAPGAREWLRRDCRPGARFAVPDCELCLQAEQDGIWLYDDDGQVAEQGAQALLHMVWPAPGEKTGWPAFWRTTTTADIDMAPPDAPLPVGQADEQLFLHAHAHVWQLLWLATQRKGMLLIEPVLLQTNDSSPESVDGLSARLFWPDWVCLLHQRMADFIETLRERHWPLHVQLTEQGASFTQLAILIPPFVAWHNQYNRPEASADAARELISALTACQASPPATEEDS